MVGEGGGEDSRRRVEEVVASALPARPTQPRMQTMTDPPCDCMGTTQAISDPTVKGKKRKKERREEKSASGWHAGCKKSCRTRSRVPRYTGFVEISVLAVRVCPFTSLRINDGQFPVRFRATTVSSVDIC